MEMNKNYAPPQPDPKLCEGGGLICRFTTVSQLSRTVPGTHYVPITIC